MNYDTQIEEYYLNSMPAEIKRLFNKTISDLYNGPLYKDADGEPCSCFDEGAVQFNFSGARRELSKWADENVQKLYMLPWCGELETAPPDEEDEEYYEWGARDCMNIVFGELARYL